MILLYNGLDTLTEDNISRLIPFLPDFRRKKALNYRFFNGKAACTIAYMLFLYGYRRFYGINGTPDFDYDDNGKPYLKSEPELFFNISHCDNAAACIFSDIPVGMDIQNYKRINLSLINKICSPRETDFILSSSEPDAEFCRLWTEKEAASKYTGEGILRNFRRTYTDGLFFNSRHIEPDMYITTASGEDKIHEIIKIGLDDIYSLF